jgi:regulator of RNase E activity RraA
VLPGDLIDGDGEGIIVVPISMAEEVVRAAHELEQRAKYILSKIEAGSSILAVYPPDEDTLNEYEQWVNARTPRP